MVIMADFNLNDGLLIAATILGPILAVQAQKFVERATENRRRKLQVFATLMTTRAARLSPEHVQALNTIELLFSRGWFWQKKEKAVIIAWRVHLDNLTQPWGDDEASMKASNERAFNSFVELMFAMSQALGYDFDRVQIKRSAYYPIGHFNNETAQQHIQQSL